MLLNCPLSATRWSSTFRYLTLLKLVDGLFEPDELQLEHYIEQTLLVAYI